MQEHVEKTNDVIEKKRRVEWIHVMPIVYVLYVYIEVMTLFVQPSELSVWSNAMSIIFRILTMLAPAMGIVNVVVAILYCKPQYKKELFNAAIGIKYALIPFFILGGVLIVCCCLISLIPVPFMIFVGVPAAIVGSVIGWFIMAFGAPYMISYLHLSVKEGDCSRIVMVIHSILQFFFVCDVVDVMVLSYKEQRWRKLTTVIIGLMIVSIVVIFVWFTWKVLLS